MFKKGFLVLLVVFATVKAQDDLFELNIIHYNDFHAHFEEVSPHGTPCNPEEDPCVGGIARLSTAINQALEDQPDSLLLNGGDTYQGTIWYNLLRWNVTTYFMNALPYHDAHVLGNHEFDHGIEGLIPYLEQLNSTMLGANVNAAEEPEIQQLFQNHVVVTRGNRQIGIIGVLLTQFSAPIGKIVMEDEVEAVNREARILTEQGVDIIIVLSHCGLDNDRFIAARVVPEVDAIVGAHSHTLLYNGEAPDGGSAAGPYPVVVEQASGHRIPIVQASCYTRYLGIFKLYIDDAGVVQHWSGQPVYLGTSIVQDPRMLELLEPWREEVDKVGKEVLGRSRVTLNRSRCRNGECNMGSWACDGFLDQVMSLAQSPAWNHAHLCLINNGGMRVQINPGNVTTEVLLMALPFENRIQTFDLRGRHLLEALEFSVSGNINPQDFNSGRMLQIAGLRVVFNASEADGARVAAAAVRCIECGTPRFEPLEPDALYRVVTQSYIGDGGGGYTMLSDNRENLMELAYDYEMLQDFIRRQGTILQDLDGRIQVVT